MKNSYSNAVGAALCGRPLTKGFPNSGAHRGAPLHSLSFLRKQESISFFKNYTWIPVFTGMTQSKFKERLGGIFFLKNSKGISVLFLIIAMLLMVTIGYVFSYLIPTKQKSVVFPIQSTQAFFIAQSGVEFAVRYAKDQGWTTPALLLGLNGLAVYQRNLGAGRFTINYTNTTDTLTSSGEVPTGTQRRQIVVSNFTSFLYYFAYHRSITVQTGQVSNGPLAYFPMLVSITDATLATVANGGHVASYNDGTHDPWDIVFMALDDTTCGGAGTSPCRLNHEIEAYSQTSGQLVAWVRVPSINTNTVIYMYYGNSCVPSSMQNVTGVWDTNYKGVWHLKETGLNGSAGEVKDSTNQNNGAGRPNTPTYTGPTGGATGKINSAFDFPSGDVVGGAYVNVGNNASLQITGNLTIEAWVKPDVSGYYMGIAGKLNDSNGGGTQSGFALAKSDTNYYRFLVGDATDYQIVNSNTTYTDTGWHHIVGVVSSGTDYLYVGGIRQTATGNNIIHDSGAYAYMGKQYSNYDRRYWNGIIDEVRISNIVRSADWILTEYNNQNAPGNVGVPGFYAVGGELNN